MDGPLAAGHRPGRDPGIVLPGSCRGRDGNSVAVAGAWRHQSREVCATREGGAFGADADVLRYYGATYHQLSCLACIDHPPRSGAGSVRGLFHPIPREGPSPD